MKTKLIIPALMATAAMSSHAAVLYSEAFPNSGNANVATSSVSWTGYLGSSAAATSDPQASPRWAIAGANGPDQTRGYLFKDTASSGIGAAVENNAFSILPANITNFTYLAGNSTATASTSFIVQQSGNWFVSTTNFTTAAQSLANYNSSTASTAELKTLNFNTLSTSWNALTINPGVELSVGAATALSPTAPITSIGIFANGGGTMRMDDITINGVPEPTTALLSALGGLALLRRRR